MGKITILEETTKNPISLMGRRAGVCWGAGNIVEVLNYEDIKNSQKYKSE